MKKVVVLLVIVLCVACSREDNLTLEIFELVAYEIDTSLDINNDGVFSTNLVGQVGCFRNEELLILSDGTGTSYSSGDLLYRESANIFNESGISKFLGCDNATTGSKHEFSWKKNGNAFETEGQGITVTGIKTDTTIAFIMEDGFTFRIVNELGEEVWLTQDVTHRYELVQE